ncbi:MAG: hypothetical protein CBB87_08035 [Micavibrio sp. TMED27]|nr:hypothetical protein [Micavibrio sp.]OUT90620.1 MAG: hypothetical protein CBB87_08035 [Micavibrio sp. TMED27]|tara:strand:- start:14900 stop:16366 length:1467 start_codon:yes stop_codon:yes gene_type:complete
MINFNQISAREIKPGSYAEFSLINANTGLYDYPTRILVIGQKLATGSADELTTQIIADEDQAKALFGQGSQIALMCGIILGIQDTIEVHAIAQDDAAASATASGSIVVTNAATASGTLFLYIAGQGLQIGVSALDTAAEAAAKIVAAINEENDLPVTAVINGGDDTQVDITSKNAGLTGNEIKIVTNYYRGEVLPEGFAINITQLAGGTTNPDVTDVLDAIEGEWFTEFLMPYTDASNLKIMEDELERRFSPNVKMDATLSIAHRGTFAENYTFTNAQNSEFVTCIDVPADAPQPAYLWAAAIVAWTAFWSQQHPVRPYLGLVLKGIKPPKTRRTDAESRILLNNGCTTWKVNADGNVSIERLVTMYQVNAAGIEDDVFLDITKVKQLSFIRYDHNAYISTLYFGEEARVLTTSEAAAAASTTLVTPKTIAASSTARAQLWISAGWVSELVDIRAEVDQGDPTRVNMLMAIDPTDPLMIIATKMDIRG